MFCVLCQLGKGSISTSLTLDVLYLLILRVLALVAALVDVSALEPVP